VRTVFLGTSDFAAALLERLAGGPAGPDRSGTRGLEDPVGQHRPALVITRPDRPAGRGRKLTSPPVAGAARALGLRLAQPESVNGPDAQELIAEVAPDVLVVCAFGALVKEPLLSGYELLNVHPSLLPRWRGAAPIERAIMAGDERTGVSIMRLTAGLDSGPVCLARSEPILAQDTFGSLAPRLQQSGGELLVSALDALDRGERLSFAEQDERLATYAEKIPRPTACSTRAGPRSSSSGSCAPCIPTSARAWPSLTEPLSACSVRHSRPVRPPASACTRARVACYSTAQTACWSCWWCSRRASVRWTRARSYAAMGLRAPDDPAPRAAQG